MSTKDKFIHLLKVTGFSDKVIKNIFTKVSSDEDIEDILSIVSSVPNISTKTLLNYVDVIVSNNKGGNYETIYIWKNACRGA